MKNKRNLKTWLGKCGNVAALCVIAVFMCYGIVSGGAEPAQSEKNPDMSAASLAGAEPVEPAETTEPLESNAGAESLAGAEPAAANAAAESAESTESADTAGTNAGAEPVEPTETVDTAGTNAASAMEPDGVLDGFINPVAEGYISSSFGERNGRRHTGLDIAAPQGSEIMAAADGLATFAGENGGYGNYLVIDHGGGVETRYAHCSEILVKEGDRVGRGEVVALVGSTGNSTGPHLHFEITENGEFLDPAERVSYN